MTPSASEPTNSSEVIVESMRRVDLAYQFQHSVEVGVSRKTAWRFWTNVGNWVLDVAIEWVKLDGPFKPGSHGTTKTRGADLVEWEIIEVSEEKSAVIEIPMPGATAQFAWKFEELTEERTRLTQQITLSGKQAEMYGSELGGGFEQGIREGMQKLSSEIERSADGSRSSAACAASHNLFHCVARLRSH